MKEKSISSFICVVIVLHISFISRDDRSDGDPNGHRLNDDLKVIDRGTVSTISMFIIRSRLPAFVKVELLTTTTTAGLRLKLGPAACNSQEASPFGCLNNFCLTFGVTSISCAFFFALIE